MIKQTSKAQLLNDIRVQRRRLEKTLSTLSQDQLVQPGVVGSWSVKDILAHLVAWERLFLDWYQSGIQVTPPSTPPVGMSRRAIAALNQQIYAQNAARSLEAILADFHASRQQVLSTLEAIPEGDIFTHGRFAWTGKLALADYIAGNTCNHDAWANTQVRKWMKREAAEKKN